MSVDIEDPVLREQIFELGCGGGLIIKIITGKCLFLKREGSVVQGKKGSVFSGQRFVIKRGFFTVG